MKVRELILELAKYNLDKDVTINDPNYGEYSVHKQITDTPKYIILGLDFCDKKGDYFND